MATLEERLQTLEQEHAQLKKTIELQTIAIGALVNKATLEKLNEKYDKLFETLTNHDHFTNAQLAELRNQQTEFDGKVVGLQTEMRQRFSEQDTRVTALDGKVVGLQTEMRQRFSEQDTRMTALDGKVVSLQTEMRQRFAEQDTRMTALDAQVTALDGKVTGLQMEMRQRFTEQDSKLGEQATLLQQILARLPEK